MNINRIMSANLYQQTESVNNVDYTFGYYLLNATSAQVNRKPNPIESKSNKKILEPRHQRLSQKGLLGDLSMGVKYPFQHNFDAVSASYDSLNDASIMQSSLLKSTDSSEEVILNYGLFDTKCPIYINESI